MNKRQKFQASLATFCAIYIIAWLFFPGWGASKILGISAGVLTLIAMFLSYRAEEKKKHK